MPRAPKLKLNASPSMGDLATSSAAPVVDERLLLSSFASRFTINSLLRSYQMFQGDLIMALVFGQITQYNVARALRIVNAQTARTPTAWKKLIKALLNEKISPCNALSISEATGIPRETVRRKVKELEKRQWLHREGANKLTLAPQALNQFNESGLKLLQEFMETASVIRGLEEAIARQVQGGSVE